MFANDAEIINRYNLTLQWAKMNDFIVVISNTKDHRGDEYSQFELVKEDQGTVYSCETLDQVDSFLSAIDYAKSNISETV